MKYAIMVVCMLNLVSQTYASEEGRPNKCLKYTTMFFALFGAAAQAQQPLAPKETYVQLPKSAQIIECMRANDINCGIFCGKSVRNQFEATVAVLGKAQLPLSAVPAEVDQVIDRYVQYWAKPNLIKCLLQDAQKIENTREDL